MEFNVSILCYPDIIALQIRFFRIDIGAGCVNFVRIRQLCQRRLKSLYIRHILGTGIMNVYLQNSPPDEPVYQFMDKKRAEGKPYRVYMMASANKFLRIYYATVKAYLEAVKHV